MGQVLYNLVLIATGIDIMLLLATLVSRYFGCLHGHRNANEQEWEDHHQLRAISRGRK